MRSTNGRRPAHATISRTLFRSVLLRRDGVSLQLGDCRAEDSLDAREPQGVRRKRRIADRFHWTSVVVTGADEEIGGLQGDDAELRRAVRSGEAFSSAVAGGGKAEWHANRPKAGVSRSIDRREREKGRQSHGSRITS